ncbi:MAG: hypothetical protein ACLUJG_07145 [Lawsonibacter sp.]
MKPTTRYALHSPPKNQILYQRCHVMGTENLAGVVLDRLTIFIDKCDLNITVRLTTWIVRSPVVANAVCHAIAEVGVPVAGQISLSFCSSRSVLSLWKLTFVFQASTPSVFIGSEFSALPSWVFGSL